MDLQDLTGTQHRLELPGYHMPTAKVQLLSLQVLPVTHGGTFTQSAKNVIITYGDGTSLSVAYSPRSNLLYHTHTSTTATSKANRTRPYTSLVDNTNSNLTAAQKELLHWHQQLSHASITWVQTLMGTKCHSFPATLNAEPIIMSKYKQGLTCDLSTLKCQACLFAKAHKQPHNPTLPGPKLTLTPSFDTPPRTLRDNHQSPGNCISTNHYISSTHG